MELENKNLFKRALHRLAADTIRTGEWDHPWKVELSKPDEFTSGIPYHHAVQVRSDIERLITKHDMKVLLSETVPGYNIETDNIHIPRPSTFKSRTHWYQTLFHEMGHWTGKRVGRGFTMQIDHPMITGCEEVIAELTSAFLCEAFDIKGEQHATYINTYAGAIPPSLFKPTMAQAVKATNYLLQK